MLILLTKSFCAPSQPFCMFFHSEGVSEVHLDAVQKTPKTRQCIHTPTLFARDRLSPGRTRAAEPGRGLEVDLSASGLCKGEGETVPELWWLSHGGDQSAPAAG